MAELKVWDTDPNIYLFTSLTAGSSHIITATSRMETILKANKIPFKGVDTATNESAKKLFRRRASGKKLPLIVKEGYVLGGIEEVEEWNEYDELREALGVTSSFTPLPAKPSAAAAPVSSTATVPTKKETVVQPNPAQNLAIRQLGAEAAKAAAAKKQTPAKISTTNPLLTEKTNTPTSATPAKSPAKADASILSPRSIPLPQTPSTSSSAVPNLSNLQKPVHAPPSMHADAADTALSAGPASKTQTKDEAEESSEEEDSEEEEEDEDEDEEESEEEEDTSEEEEEGVADDQVDTKANDAVKTQEQDAKDPSKAGESVKEGEEQESSEEESSEEDKVTPAAPVATDKPTTDDKEAADNSKTAGKQKVPDKKSSTKKRSMAEKLALAEKKRQAEKKKLAEEKKLAEKKRATDKKKLAEKKKVSSTKKTLSTKKIDSKAKTPTKTQEQGAKDASEAGESVLD